MSCPWELKTGTRCLQFSANKKFSACDVQRKKHRARDYLRRETLAVATPGRIEVHQDVIMLGNCSIKAIIRELHDTAIETARGHCLSNHSHLFSKLLRTKTTEIHEKHTYQEIENPCRS